MPQVDEAEDEKNACHHDEDPSEHRSRIISDDDFVVPGQVWRSRWWEMVEEGHPRDIGIVEHMGRDPCSDACGERHQRQQARTPGEMLRPPDQIDWSQYVPPPGFHVLSRRWVVEPTFAWLLFNRRLSRDYERLCATTETWSSLAMIRLMLRRLVRRQETLNGL
jgi:transposase